MSAPKQVPGRWLVASVITGNPRRALERSLFPTDKPDGLSFEEARDALIKAWADYIKAGRVDDEASLRVIVATEAIETCGPDFRFEYRPGMWVEFEQVDR